MKIDNNNDNIKLQKTDGQIQQPKKLPQLQLTATTIVTIHFKLLLLQNNTKNI